VIGLHEAIARHATVAGSVALDDGAGGTVGYAQLVEAVELKAAALLAETDLGRPIALDLDHGIESAVAELAALDQGLAVLSLPRFFTPSQREHAVRACGAGTWLDRTGLTKLDNGDVPLPAGTARITFTSGSTGKPKGICLSAGHMLTVARAVVEAVGAEHAGRHLAVLPPGILLETVAGFLPTLLAGGTYICPPQAAIGLGDPFRPDFAMLLVAVNDLAITSLILVPEYLAGLVAAMEATGQRLPRLTLVAVGGARTPPALLARARALGLPVRQGYGLTECASVVSLQEPGDLGGGVGLPLPHVRAMIAADGEILLDGPLHLGVIGEPRAPGPLATGDIGRIDEAGRLHIEGRKTSLIVTSFGRNISPEWIEEALLGQPGVAQALVYGDGLAAPRALIVASSSDADLEGAVASVNATLPGYAQVAGWRPAAPFTPANEQLTGNGRMVRKAILAAYPDDATPFFTQLEAATWPDRLRFLSIPQVRAGLAGAISRETYVAYLTQAYHHVRHTVPLMREARARLGHRPDLVTALDDYIAEETGHEEWILNDIAAAGGNAALARSSAPAAATQAMVDHAYARIRTANPASFFGMVYVLESVSVALATHGAGAIAARLGLPPQAFSYLTSHGALDQSHMRFFENLVNGLGDEADRSAIRTMARDIFALFGAMFAAIPLEPFDVAA
jgi:acyl-CoA synthetase (AMP-forming)/AMP-acid ligase II